MSTNTKRKIRGDAKLEMLNAVQREMLHFLFEENCTYDEITGLLQQEFGLTVGKSAVSVYWRRHFLPEQQDCEVETVTARTTLPAADFDAATLQHVRVMAWTRLAQPEPEVDQGLKLMGAIHKAERLALARERHTERNAIAVERLALAERRVEVMEEREARLAKKAGTEKIKEENRKIGKRGKAEVAREVRETERSQTEARDGEPRNTGPGEQRTSNTEHRTSNIEHRTSKDGESGAGVASDSLEVVGRGEGAEGADVRPPSTDSRSWLQAEGGGSVEASDGVEVAVTGPGGEKVKNTEENLPLSPGYSGVSRAESEAGAEKMKDETWETGKREEAEESAGVAGRSESVEVAAKARSCEGRSEGAEGRKLGSREIGKVEDGNGAVDSAAPAAGQIVPSWREGGAGTEGAAAELADERASGTLNPGRLGETPLPAELAGGAVAGVPVAGQVRAVAPVALVQLAMPGQEELMRRNERRLAQERREAKAPREQW